MNFEEMSKEELIDYIKNINEYIETIMMFSNNIQKDYYKDLLKIK